MSQDTTHDLDGVVKRADQLAANDLVVEVPEYGQPPRPMRVVAAQPFKDANGNPMVALMLDAFDGREPMYVRTTAGTKYDTAPKTAPDGPARSVNGRDENGRCIACKHEDEHWHDHGCEHRNVYDQRYGCMHVPSGA